jgi:hypothetical protein
MLNDGAVFPAGLLAFICVTRRPEIECPYFELFWNCLQISQLFYRRKCCDAT